LITNQLAEKVVFSELLKNAQMQVELCEIPFKGSPEILRNEVYLDVRHNDEGRGKRSRWAFFSSLLNYPRRGG
jgi:hypothetical protein